MKTQSTKFKNYETQSRVHSEKCKKMFLNICNAGFYQLKIALRRKQKALNQWLLTFWSRLKVYFKLIRSKAVPAMAQPVLLSVPIAAPSSRFVYPVSQSLLTSSLRYWHSQSPVCHCYFLCDRGYFTSVPVALRKGLVESVKLKVENAKFKVESTPKSGKKDVLEHL